MRMHSTWTVLLMFACVSRTQVPDAQLSLLEEWLAQKQAQGPLAPAPVAAEAGKGHGGGRSLDSVVAALQQALQTRKKNLATNIISTAPEVPTTRSPSSGRSSPFVNTVDLNQLAASNSNTGGGVISQGSADPETKPFFHFRCKDCNIAVSDKEVLEFVQKTFEQLTQPGQTLLSGPEPRKAFDGECINCNLLIGAQEALAAAAKTMFNTLRTSHQKSSSSQP